MTADQITAAAEAAWQAGYHDDWDDSWHDDFVNGFRAQLAGLKQADNPHKPSGHERDTSYEDEAHFQWYRGYWAGYDYQKEQV